MRFSFWVSTLIIVVVMFMFFVNILFMYILIGLISIIDRIQLNTSNTSSVMYCKEKHIYNKLDVKSIVNVLINHCFHCCMKFFSPFKSSKSVLHSYSIKCCFTFLFILLWIINEVLSLCLVLEKIEGKKSVVELKSNLSFSNWI